MKQLISELSQIEVATLTETDPVVFFPVGSQEQHGYLPTGIDNLLAAGYSHNLNQFLQSKNVTSVILPTLEYGHTPICQGYPGTISLSKKTFQAVVTEVLVEIMAQGFKKIVVVNGHRDNQSAIDEVISALSQSFPTAMLLNPIYAWLRTTEEFVKKYPDREVPLPVHAMDDFVQKVGLLRHADAAEMSLFYALYPEKKSEYEQLLPDQQLPDLHSQLLSTHDEWLAVTAETKGGAGDPRNVQISEAEKVIEAMCQQLLADLA